MGQGLITALAVVLVSAAVLYVLLAVGASDANPRNWPEEVWRSLRGSMGQIATSLVALAVAVFGSVIAVHGQNTRLAEIKHSKKSFEKDKIQKDKIFAQREDEIFAEKEARERDFSRADQESKYQRARNRSADDALRYSTSVSALGGGNEIAQVGAVLDLEYLVQKTPEYENRCVKVLGYFISKRVADDGDVGEAQSRDSLYPKGKGFDHPAHTEIKGTTRELALQVLGRIRNNKSSRVNLRGLNFNRCDFDKGYFGNIDFRNSSFREAQMSECDLSNSWFKGSEMTGVFMERTIVSGALMESIPGINVSVKSMMIWHEEKPPRFKYDDQ